MSIPRSRSSLDALGDVWSRRKWPALVFFAASLSAAAGMTFSLPDVYRSTATVLVKREQVSATIVSPTVTGEIDTRLRTIGEEVLSRSRLLDLIDRYRLYSDRRGTTAPEILVDRMRREIRLETRGNADPGAAHGETIALAVSFQGTDPMKVSSVANALAAAYVEENLAAREGETAGTADFLKTQLEQTKKRLDEQALRLSEFSSRHTGELPQQMGANLATLERLNTQLQQNRERQTSLAERLEKPVFAPRSEGTTPEASESVESRVLRLERQLAALRARYSETYPDVVQIRAELAALKRESAGSGSGPRAAPPRRADGQPLEAGAGLEALRAEERRLVDQISSYQARVENTAGREQELAVLSRDYETAKQMYQSLLQRDEEARLAGDLERRRMGSEIRILDAAVPSSLPFAPNRPRLLIMGLAISIGIALGAAALAEQADSSFHSVDSLKAFTKVPVLISIPRMEVERGAARLVAAGLAAFAFVVGMAGVAGLAYLLAHDNEQLVALLSRGGS